MKKKQKSLYEVCMEEHKHDPAEGERYYKVLMEQLETFRKNNEKDVSGL